MKTLQECQAEVFRRGERKIRQRRRRTAGILLTCVPLAICLMLLPLGGRETAEKKENFAQQELADSGLSVTCVEVYSTTGSYSLTNSGDIRYLMALMESYSLQHSMADGATGSIEQDPEAAPEKFATQGETMDADEDAQEEIDRNMLHETDKGYTVTLIMDDGSEVTYFLLENMMTDVQTGQVTVLSRQQAENIRTFLEGKVVDQ